MAHNTQSVDHLPSLEKLKAITAASS